MALTTELAAAVRRQGAIPSTVLDADIFLEGDLAIQTEFIPLLESLRQNYFVRELTATPDARGRVPLPARAVGAGLRSVHLAVGNEWIPLPQRDLADVDYLSSGPSPSGFALDGGSMVLLPTGVSGTVRLRYSARPGRMCSATDLALAAPIATVTVGATTTTLTTTGVFTGGTVVDVVSAGPAHQQKAINATRAGLVLSNADLTEAPAAGDYLAVADRSPFVPLPEELFGALAHKVATNLLLSAGYLEEAAAQRDAADRAVALARNYLMPRIEGNPKTVSGGLRQSLGRSAVAMRSRWW